MEANGGPPPHVYQYSGMPVPAPPNGHHYSLPPPAGYPHPHPHPYPYPHPYPHPQTPIPGIFPRQDGAVYDLSAKSGRKNARAQQVSLTLLHATYV